MKSRKSRLQNSDAVAARSGQAMVELMIGMVAVMVLIAGILQIASMTKAHTDVMIEAREEVGELAMLDLGSDMDVLSNPDYIRDWSEGPDNRRLSRDDDFNIGDAGAFQSIIVDRTVQDAGGWEIIDSAPDNRLSRLRSDSIVVTSFGLVKGSASESSRLDMLPAFRHLVYRSATIDVEATTWMTLCGGIY